MLDSSTKINIAKQITEEIWKSTEDKIELSKYCEIKLKDTLPSLNAMQIGDIIDEIVEKVSFYINKKIEHCKEIGIAPNYEFNDLPRDGLFRYSLKYKESPLISFLRKQKQSLLKLINKMPWQSFEHLCTRLLQIYGVNPIKVTKVNQEGIDFCGLYNIGNQSNFMIIPKSFKIKVVGQVKHYSNKIQPKSVRSFNTYCEDVKHEKTEIMNSLPSWFAKNKAPVLGIFITTSDFTKATIIYARKEWIILKNGEQVLEDLIKSPLNKNWIQNKNGQLVLNEDLFYETFKQE